MSRENSYFSNKKTVLQFILSLYVFFIHFRVFSVFSDGGNFINTLFNTLLTLTKVAVPLFFVISGALFYRDYTLSATFRKWKNRFFSLCIPYLIWNSFWLVLALLGYYTPLGAYLGGVRTPFTWEAVFYGVFFYRFFEPFWFILQLIVLTAFCPIIYLILKNKYVGLSAIILLFLLYGFGFSFPPALFKNTSMVIFYLIGAWVGLHHFNWLTVRQSKKHAILGLVIYILCCSFFAMHKQLPQWATSLQMSLVVQILASFAFYISFDYIEIHSCPRYMSDTFLIYSMHSLVGATIAKLLRMVLPAGELYTLITAVIAFPATIVFICVFGQLLGKYTPGIKRLLTGR